MYQLGQDVPGVKIGTTYNVGFDVLPIYWKVLFKVVFGFIVVFGGNNDSLGDQSGIQSYVTIILYSLASLMYIIWGHYMIGCYVEVINVYCLFYTHNIYIWLSYEVTMW